MKKCLCAGLILVLLLTLSVPAFAEGSHSGSCGENLTWTLDADGLLTISGTGRMAFEEKDPPWEEYKDSITALKLEDGITFIETSAFYGIEGLTELTLPGSLEYTGFYAFGKCPNLRTVVIEEGVDTIAGSCFADDKGLKTVYLPASLRHVDRYAFSGCDMDAVYLADLRSWCDAVVQELHSSPLSHADSLYIAGEKVTHLVIPEGVEWVNDFLFLGCRGITELTLPSTMKSVPYRSFQECMNLKKITVSEGTESIEDLAFWDCERLTEIYLPASLNHIGYYALEFTYALRDVYYAGDRESWDKLAQNCNVSSKAVIHCNDGPAVTVEGDLDGDGVLSLKDVSLLYGSYTGRTELAEGTQADLNGDGRISLLDVAMLYQAYIKASN